MGSLPRFQMSDTEEQPVEKKKEKKVYRRDKPWDNDSIDHWKIDQWTEDDAKASSHFLEESSFATLFPQYREKYLREIWSEVTRTLDKSGIAYNPFPPEQIPRKIDEQLESGEYFLSQDTKKRKKDDETALKQEQSAVKQAKKRRKAFKQPAELPVATSGGMEVPQEKVGDLAERVKKRGKKLKKK